MTRVFEKLGPVTGSTHRVDAGNGDQIAQRLDQIERHTQVSIARLRDRRPGQVDVDRVGIGASRSGVGICQRSDL